MSDADCTPGREPRSVAASFSLVSLVIMFCTILASITAADVIENTMLGCREWPNEKAEKLAKYRLRNETSEGSTLIFWMHSNRPVIKCRVRRAKPSCRKPARCVEPFQNNTGACDGETDTAAIIARYAYASCGKKPELRFVVHVLYPISLLHTTFIHQKMVVQRKKN